MAVCGPTRIGWDSLRRGLVSDRRDLSSRSSSRWLRLSEVEAKGRSGCEHPERERLTDPAHVLARRPGRAPSASARGACSWGILRPLGDPHRSSLRRGIGPAVSGYANGHAGPT